MNSLLNYGSDDDNDDSTDEKLTDTDGGKPLGSKHLDANYEEVQMDLSEESNDGRNEKDSRRSREDRNRNDREKDKRRRDDRDRDRYRDRRERDRSRERRRSSSKSRRSGSKSRRSDSKERRSSSKDERSLTKERRSRDRSHERKRSRSPRRSRSRSRDRARKLKRFRDRIDEDARKDEEKNTNNRFFMPGITGRFRDQIERRKLLWQKKEPEVKEDSSKTKKVWETTTFAQDTDGKVASKFKRLMGIKNATEAASSSTDVLKKQEEMFSSMEQQYEVARTATHTMRGVGLGFGSFQR